MGKGREVEVTLQTGPGRNQEHGLEEDLRPALTCSRGRGMHRRQSCSGGGWGRSWRRSPPAPAGLWGSRDAGDTRGLRSGHSTHLAQTPGQDWTSPVWGIKERLPFKYGLLLFFRRAARVGGECGGLKIAWADCLLSAHCCANPCGAVGVTSSQPREQVPWPWWWVGNSWHFLESQG